MLQRELRLDYFLNFVVGLTEAMAAHLSHKIRWEFFAEYLTPYQHTGITLPVGDCGRIHTDKRKHEIQVEMRNFISEDMICKDENCRATGEREFRKNSKRVPPFKNKGKGDEKKLLMFVESLYDAVDEFALTELKTPAKQTIEYDDTKLDGHHPFTFCERCNKFINHLEFGDKQKLFEYSEPELQGILRCLHGGQAVGNNIMFLLFHILRFYVYSNAIVYLDLRKEDQWPEFMKPKSYFRSSLLSACDGQTFLPYSRKFLASAMIDLNETRELSKRLFKFIYFYVMIRMKLDSSYKLQDDFDWRYFRYF